MSNNQIEAIQELTEQVADQNMDSLDWMYLGFAIDNHVDAPDQLNYPHADRLLVEVIRHYPEKLDELIGELDGKVAQYVRRRRPQLESYATQPKAPRCQSA